MIKNLFRRKKKEDGTNDPFVDAFIAKGAKKKYTLGKPNEEYQRMEGITEAYVNTLLDRDDEFATLQDMLNEDEEVSIADIINRKRIAEEQGEWEWPKPKKTIRMERLIEGLPIGDDLLEDTERRPDPPGSLQELAKRQPVALRTPTVCTWIGYDDKDNVYLCNNEVLFDQNTYELTKFCGYHTTNCVVPHSDLNTGITAPNEYGLCYTHHVQFHNRPPRFYEDNMFVPGIVFAAKAIKTHSLAPPLYMTKTIEKPKDDEASADQNEDTSDAEGDDSEEKAKEDVEKGPTLKERLLKMTNLEDKNLPSLSALKPKAFTKMSKKAVELSKAVAAIRTQRDQEAAATLIQSVVRRRQAQRLVERMRRREIAQKRTEAARTIQRMWRTILTIRELRRKMQNAEYAATKIQRGWRYFVWERKLKRDRLLVSQAELLQKWWRAIKVRETLEVVAIRAQAKRHVAQVKKPRGILRKLVILCQFRKLVLARKREMKRQLRAAVAIQRAWFQFTGRAFRSPDMLRREKARSTFRGACFFFKWIRMYFRRREMRAWRKHVLKCAALINRVGRGYLGRIEMRVRRERVKRVWDWIAPIIPKEQVADFLMFPDYDKMFDLKSFVWDGKHPMPRSSQSRSRRTGKTPPGTAGSAGSTSGDQYSFLKDGFMESLDQDPLEESHPKSLDNSAVDANPDNKEESQIIEWPDDIVFPDGLTAEQLEELEEGDAEAANRIKEERKRYMETFRNPSLLHTGIARRPQSTDVSKLFEKGASGLEAIKNIMEKRRSRLADKKLIPMDRPNNPEVIHALDRYGIMLQRKRRDLQLPAASVVHELTEEEMKEQKAYISRMRDLFRVVDKEDRGFIAPATFERVLRQGGLLAPKRLLERLSQSFATEVGGNVSWHEYIAFAEGLKRPCPQHGVLVCPLCVYRGPCSKCACKRYVPAAEEITPSTIHSSACQCGHLRSGHSTVIHGPKDVWLPQETSYVHSQALGKSAALDKRLLHLTGRLEDPDSMSIAGKIFSPAPASIEANVRELWKELEENRPLDISESLQGVRQDRENGVGSATYYQTKREMVKERLGGLDPVRMGSEGVGNLSKKMPKGVKIESTVLVTPAQSGKLVPLMGTSQQSLENASYLQLETRYLAHTLARSGGGQASTRRKGGNPVPISTSFINTLHMDGIRATKNTLEALIDATANDNQAALARETYRLKELEQQLLKVADGKEDGPSDSKDSDDADVLKKKFSDVAPPPTSIYTPGADLTGVIASNPNVQVLRTSADDPTKPLFPEDTITVDLAYTAHGIQDIPNMPPLFMEGLIAGEAIASGAMLPTRNNTEGLFHQAISRVHKNQRDAACKHYIASQPTMRSTHSDANAVPSDAHKSAFDLDSPHYQNAITPLSPLSPTPNTFANSGTGSAGRSVTITKPTIKKIDPDANSSTLGRDTFLYLVILRTLCPLRGSLYDILYDPSRLATFLSGHYVFLQRYWRDIVMDIRHGSVRGGPPLLTVSQRQALSTTLSPDPVRADILAAMFVAVGFNAEKPAPFPAKEYTEEEVAALKDPGIPLPQSIVRLREEKERMFRDREEARVRDEIAMHLAGIIAQNYDKRISSSPPRSRSRKKRLEIEDYFRAGLNAITEDVRVEGGGDAVFPRQVEVTEPSSLEILNKTRIELPAGPLSMPMSPTLSKPLSPKSFVYNRSGAGTLNRFQKYNTREFLEGKQASISTPSAYKSLPAQKELLESVKEKMSYRQTKENETLRISLIRKQQKHVENTMFLAQKGYFPIPEGFLESQAEAQETLRIMSGMDENGLFRNTRKKSPSKGTSMSSGSINGMFSTFSVDDEDSEALDLNAVAEPAADDKHTPKYDAFRPPLHYVAAPAPAAVIDALGYSFHVIPGPRPYMCKFVGCGQTFGSTGAGVRHMRLAHNAQISPLHVQTANDPLLAKTLKDVGIDGAHYLPPLDVPAKSRVAAVKALRSQANTPPRRSR